MAAAWFLSIPGNSMGGTCYRSFIVWPSWLREHILLVRLFPGGGELCMRLTYDGGRVSFAAYPGKDIIVVGNRSMQNSVVI
jgi:hypothetical protein